MNVFDYIFGNCKKGRHDFKEFLVEKIPPDTSVFRGVETSVAGMVAVIESLTVKTHEIRCTHCGKKIEETRNE